MKKRVLALIFGVIMSLALAGCGGGSAQPAAAEPADLTGEWTQSNPNSEEMYHVATIQDGAIEIYWFDSSTDTKALYWAGTYDAPTTADEPYTWTSANDKEKTGSAMLASGDDTKEFTYGNGVLSYEASAMGVTQIVKLERQQQ